MNKSSPSGASTMPCPRRRVPTRGNPIHATPCTVAIKPTNASA